MAVSTTEWDVNGRMKYTRINQRKLILMTESKKRLSFKKTASLLAKAPGLFLFAVSAMYHWLMFGVIKIRFFSFNKLFFFAIDVVKFIIDLVNNFV